LAMSRILVEAGMLVWPDIRLIGADARIFSTPAREGPACLE
jgi:hypothetical protein